MQTTIKDVLVKIKDHLNQKKGDNVFASLAPIKKDGQDNEEDVTITLLRIEEETSRKPQNVYQLSKDKDKIYKKINPDLCLNLYILIASHAKIYETALTEISDVILWMNELQPSNILVELQTLSFEQNNSLWQTLGSNIIPAVIYKIRLVTVISDIMEETAIVQRNEDGSPIQFNPDSGNWSDADRKLHQGLFDELTAEEIDQIKERLLQQYFSSSEPWREIQVTEEEKDKLLYQINEKEKKWLIEALLRLDEKDSINEIEKAILKKARQERLI